MKKFTLFLTAAITALAMVAAPGRMVDRQAVNKHLSKTEMMQKSNKMSKLQVKSMKPMKAAKAVSSDIITETPEGELRYYNEWGRGILINFIYLDAGESESAGEIVWADNNEVYIKNAISSLPGVGWVKGSLSDDGQKITVQYPQKVLNFEEEDEEGQIVNIPLYVSVMDYDEDYGTYLPVAEEENVVTYTIGDDGNIVMDGSKDWEYEIDPESGEEYILYPDRMVSCYYTITEQGDEGEPVEYNEWYYYGDIAQQFTPLDLSEFIINEIPDGLTYEQWALTDIQGTAKFVDVAFAGNNVYIKNIDAYTADCVVVGTMDGDKVTFPSKQFFGMNDDYGYYKLFFGVTYGEIYDEEWEDYYESYILADELVMNYDAEAKKFTTVEENTGFIMNAALDRVYYYSGYLEPVIFLQTPESLNAAPSDPSLYMYMRLDDYGQDYFDWTIPNTNVNGAIIDTNAMYYNVFVNGELYTFYPDEYPYVSEEMTDVPYDYSDDYGYDLYAYGTAHEMYIYGEGMETFGIIVYYLAPDGNLYSSHRVTYNILDDEIEYDGTIDSAINAEPTSMEFVNLQGMKVANPTAGNIYIRTITFKDGSQKVSKFIAR